MAFLMQWNAPGINPNKAEFLNFLSKLNENTPDIICIQETFLKPKNSFRIKGYNTVRQDRQNGGKGGLITLIKTGIYYEEIENPSPKLEVLATKIYGFKELVIFNVYIPPKLNCTLTDLEPLTKRKNAILIGDLNAQNPLWKSPSLNQTGRAVEALINNHDYLITNTSEPTHQAPNGTRAILDFIIIPTQIALNSHWSTINSTLGSDHQPTFLKITNASTPISSRPPKWILEKADWTQFYTLSRELITADKIISPDPNKTYENLINKLTEIALETVPRTNPKTTKQHQVPYWTSECSQAVYDRNRARNKYNKTLKVDNLIEYKRKTAQTKKLIKLTAKKYWHNFCSTLKNNTKLKTIWKMAKKNEGRVKRGWNAYDEDKQSNVFIRPFKSERSSKLVRKIQQ